MRQLPHLVYFCQQQVYRDDPRHYKLLGGHYILSNRLLIRKAARGKRVLDCFTHTGGFALNAAYGNAAHVTAVDVSETALQQGREKAALKQIQTFLNESNL